MAERINTYITEGRGCICALGNTVDTSLTKLFSNESGIQKMQFADIPETLALGRIERSLFEQESELSWFEQIVIKSAEEALSKVKLDIKK